MKTKIFLIVLFCLIQSPVWANTDHLSGNDRHWISDFSDQLPTKQDVLMLLNYSAYKVVRDNPQNLGSLPLQFVCINVYSISKYQKLEPSLKEQTLEIYTELNCETLNEPVDYRSLNFTESKGQRKIIEDANYLNYLAGFSNIYLENPNIVNNAILCWNVDNLMSSLNRFDQARALALGVSDQHCLIDIFAE